MASSSNPLDTSHPFSDPVDTSHPLSDALWEGQAALVCQLCETDPKLKFKCLRCDVMMCRRCKDHVHSKFPSAEHHTVIDIKDIGTIQEEQKVWCSKHRKQNCSVYCKSCCEAVCSLCISETHNKHETTGISEGYTLQVDMIRDQQKHVNNILNDLSKRQNKLKKIKSNEESSYIQSKQGILDYKKSLIESIEEHCGKLMRELDEEWNNISQSIEKSNQKLKSSQQTLLQQNDEVNEAIQSRNHQRVFSSGKHFKSIEKIDKEFNMTFDPVPMFVPGNVSEFEIPHGRLEHVSVNTSEELTLIGQFNTYFKSINNLISCPDGSFWTNDLKRKAIYKVNPHGSFAGPFATIRQHVVDMALFPSGDLLLSVVGSSTVKVIPSGTETMYNSPYNVSPLRPIGLHVTQNNKVIIGAKIDRPTLPVSGTRQLIVQDLTGKLERVFQYDPQHKPLFTYPVSISSTSNNKLAVIDSFSKIGQGRILLLDILGGQINIYRGHPDINTDYKPFTPVQVVCSPSDNFVVSDSRNHALHILSSIGEIITYFSLEKFGIELPVSLTYNQTGKLCIGCATYEQSQETASIYQLDNL